jgi:hypothetical protein
MVTKPDPRSLETPLDFTREWVEFVDPANAEHVIRADLTWLCSSWTCIFGRGCHGVIEGRESDGCCSHGAFFSDEADELRVLAQAEDLTAEDWQLRAVGRKRGLVVKDSVGDDEDRRRTRTVDGACVFLNRPGFAAGEGCALHVLAMRTGRSIVDTKPEVCWQLPQRREQEWVDRPDGTKVLVSSLSEFDRRGWGEGGHDLHWWCTSSPEAHIGAQPVYASNRDEIVGLIGPAAYDELVRLADARMAGGLIAPHPATTAAQTTAAQAMAAQAMAAQAMAAQAAADQIADGR